MASRKKIQKYLFTIFFIPAANLPPSHIFFSNKMIANFLLTPSGLWLFGHSPGVGSIDVKHVTCTKHICFILWCATQFCLFAIQDFYSRLILYLNRPVIVFNVNVNVEVLQLLPGLQYSCHIQGDISVDAIASLKDYSIGQRYIFQSDTFPSIMPDVWMICLLQTINDVKICNYNHFRYTCIWILCKLYNVL